MEDDEEYWLAYSYANRKPGYWLREGNYRIRIEDKEYNVDFSGDLEMKTQLT